MRRPHCSSSPAKTLGYCSSAAGLPWRLAHVELWQYGSGQMAMAASMHGNEKKKEKEKRKIGEKGEENERAVALCDWPRKRVIDRSWHLLIGHGGLHLSTYF